MMFFQLHLMTTGWKRENPMSSCIMVHQSNKEIFSVVAALPPGKSSEVKTYECSREDCQCCEMARRRESNDNIDTKNQNNIVQMSIVKAQNDVVSTQLCLYNENKDAFIAAFRSRKWSKILDLLKKLPDPRIGVEHVNEDNNKTSHDENLSEDVDE